MYRHKCCVLLPHEKHTIQDTITASIGTSNRNTIQSYTQNPALSGVL